MVLSTASTQYIVRDSFKLLIYSDEKYMELLNSSKKE
jgi:hypothetical protein